MFIFFSFLSLIFGFAVEAFDPEDRLRVRAIIKLEREADIPVLKELKVPKLRALRKKANFCLLSQQDFERDYDYKTSQTVKYFISWLKDQNPKCTPPTWKNLLTILKDIELSALAVTIEGYFKQTALPGMPGVVETPKSDKDTADSAKKGFCI